MPKTATGKAAKKAAKKAVGGGSGSGSSMKSDPESGELLASGSEEAFEEHRAAALALDARDVVVMRADALLAHHNVVLGAQAVLLQEKRIKSELPKADLDLIRKLPSIALAVLFAASRVDRRPGSTGETQALLARARALRELLITSAISLAAAGFIPAREVETIRKGKGFFDLAKDCSALAALFRAHSDKVKGKTPVTAAQIKEAGEVGAALLQVLKPSSAKSRARSSDDVSQAASLRDRLWTLLLRGYREQRRVGMWLWIDDIDDHVPPLQSRAKQSKTPSGATPKPGQAKNPA